MCHPATACPQLLVLCKPGVESTEASLVSWHKKRSATIQEPSKTKQLDQKLWGRAEPTAAYRNHLHKRSAKLRLGKPESVLMQHMKLSLDDELEAAQEKAHIHTITHGIRD